MELLSLLLESTTLASCNHVDLAVSSTSAGWVGWVHAGLEVSAADALNYAI